MLIEAAVAMAPTLFNQLTTSGGLLLVFAGGLMAYLKNLPTAIWNWLIRQVTITITVKDEEPAFHWVKEWFLTQPFMEKLRRVDLNSEMNSGELSFIPTPGVHWLWSKNRLYWLSFTRSDDKKGTWNAKRSETFTIRTFGRDRKILNQFVNEVIVSKEKSERTTSQLYTFHDYWDHNKAYTPRLLDSIVLPDGEKENLLKDIKKFFSERDRYLQLGIPYHRGYGLFGVPGSGKTSIASALGNELKMSIYAMNLAEFNDKSLKLSMSKIPKNSIVLFEDIDAVSVSKSRKEKVKEDSQNPIEDCPLFSVTLAGLLQVLDGVYAPSDVIYIMTSNHPERLDAALIRPGRIDYQLYLGKASLGQKIKLYRKFFPQDSNELAELFARTRPEDETMAAFQGALLNKK